MDAKLPAFKYILRNKLSTPYHKLRMEIIIFNSFRTNVATKMVKKSKLLAALGAHKGKDYKLEKQKILQKKAEKRKKIKQREVSADTEGTESKTEAKESVLQPDAGSEGWESDESENAAPTVVRA